jgi:serine/threonine-protein kinase
MGEVYRALDTQLDREVAVKVLPYSMASDPERLARFDREAKILAALNHPNIAVIYGMEKFEGGRALIMELVPGDTLGARIKKGAMPVEEACKVATQIAEALEAAHEKGVVHRDLKPGNVMITPTGVVKVLDFGLAAMAAPASLDSENSPTLTMGMTAAGTIMGTAAYMSPEQASGLHVDKRSDIWSYGVVLWEMLTGKRLFGGSTLAHTLADVLRAPIDVETLSAPLPLKNLIRRCLDREIRTRLRDIGEARVVIDSRADWQSAADRRSALPVLAPALAAVALIAASFLGWRHWSTPATADRPLTRLDVDLGPEAERDRRVTAVLSPDGTRIVFSGKLGNGTHQLYTRRLDQATATLLAPTTSIDLNPFFSPNGQWVGFWSGNDLYKILAEGGGATKLTTIVDPRGATWGEDDTIIIGSVNGLWRVPASGGAAVRVPNTAGPLQFPQLLPGGKAVLVGSSPNNSPTLDELYVDVVQLASGEKRNLLQGGYWPRYLATGAETGHLVYVRESTLYGVAFDPRNLELLGNPAPLLNDLAANPDLTQGGAQFSISNNGTLAYLSGNSQVTSYPISYLDASGKITPLIAKPDAYGSPRVSPDGKQLAYIAPGNSGLNLWVYDLARATPSQLTFAGEVINEVAWSRDSKHLAFQDGKSIWWIRSDGAGQKQLLLDGKELATEPVGPRPFSFAPVPDKDARLVFSPAPHGLPDVWTLPIDLTDPEHPKPGKPAGFANDPTIVEVDPAFSPDGKFLAYTSFRDLFVRSFPGPGGTWKAASEAKFPIWSPATHQIFYLSNGDDHIMVVDYTIQGDTFSAGVPRVWSPTPVRRTSVRLNFDITPDGKRVIMFPQPVAEATTGNLHTTFLQNFFGEVRRKVPVGK